MSGLQLLTGLTWQGRPVTGERSQALLAVLAADPGRAVGEGRLAAAVWAGDAPPASPGKALQVVVSRTRSQTRPDLVQRVERGYRLDPGADVDVARLGAAVAAAVEAERAGDAAQARDRARDALAVTVAAPGEETPAVEELRHDARAMQTRARLVLGRCLALLGEDAEALPLLEGVTDPDEPTLAALLRSEAAVRGAPAALQRYAGYADRVRDQLGVDPGPLLQSVHAQLVAADSPVRTGLRYDPTPLVGREDDVRRLRALVRESRVTSIVGPGGLGKTRLAHLVAREAEQPVVHFVELVGVASPDDVIGEVGSVLGVRDSVTGRRVLTAEQRSDVRGRIAQQLDLVPTLLVLDNCEHVVEAVADLVAPLVATTRDLRVLTTSRAPLAIAAEHVFGLEQLDDDAAATLFAQRARAARPGVVLEDAAVRRVVARLDGLPLAIELAAARVRAMSVDDVDRRLDDRFALLRASDRDVPDRHQTLLAVIDWSWNLLGAAEQRALRRLALFHDGFTLAAAESVLGRDAFETVESLVGQSLLAVREEHGDVRYRMLETVREFGHRRLVADGDGDAAREALRAWAVATCRSALDDIFGPRQIDAIRRLHTEDNNLADVLREALAGGDPATAVVLVAALGGAWSIRGDHARMITMLDAVERVLVGWDPPPDLVEEAVGTAGLMLMNTAIAELPTPGEARRLLSVHGAQSAQPRSRALHRVLEALGDQAIEDATEEMAALTHDPDRHVASLALQWSSHAYENNGEPQAAIEAAERGRALHDESDGPWSLALIDTILAGLHAQLGDAERARRHAAAALPVLDALEADDDSVQLRSVLATAAMLEGDLDRAEALLGEMTSRSHAGLWGGAVVTGTTRAELALARGDDEGGLALYDRAVADVLRVRFPGLSITPGYEPWTLYVESGRLCAHAHHGGGPESLAIRTRLREKADQVLAGEHGRTDFPVIGCLLFALGLWAVRHDGPADVAARLLAVAERTGYNRYTPSMAWERAVPLAEERAPGAVASALADLGDRRGPDLLEQARAALAQLP